PPTQNFLPFSTPLPVTSLIRRQTWYAQHATEPDRRQQLRRFSFREHLRGRVLKSSVGLDLLLP
ncbi:MAG: hypothetical protein M3122_09810, partial [Actinomycetota bacterium]|nr:hypothetical protein [Actinomycetota bacterium]